MDADTVNGRFDLIVLHLALVLDRLAQDPALQTVGQGIFDRFCQDMDYNLREMGVGDLKVPKQMRQLGEAFCGSAGLSRGLGGDGRCDAGGGPGKEYLRRSAGSGRGGPPSCGLYTRGVT